MKRRMDCTAFEWCENHKVIEPVVDWNDSEEFKEKVDGRDIAIIFMVAFIIAMFF